MQAAPARSDLIASEKLFATAQNPYWRKLLHYSHSFLWSAPRGEVDGEGFYLSPDGRTDALAELKATIVALESGQKVGKLKQAAACAFPERLRYLKKELGVAVRLPGKGDCPEYDAFIEKIQPQGIALVFSSAFADSPGSMFGHTFLKVKSGRKSDLLDYGISFAATVPPKDGGLLYVVFGLMGGYAGQFSFLPYHQKVQEYVNSESRDLWEYTLNLSAEESLRLVNHLWELESNSWFDYYFIGKNCSYQLLTALEVAKPEWDLSSGWFYVVPAETLKRVLEVPGAATQVRYRPSLRRKMIQGMGLLSKDEKEEFASLISGRREDPREDTKDIKDPKEINSPAVLSVAIQYVQYHRAESVNEVRTDLLSLWNKVLERRAELGAVPDPVALEVVAYQEPPVDQPQMGHGPLRVGLGHGVGVRDGQSALGFEELHIKFAYHDLLNSDLGYLPFSEINFPNLTFRYQPREGSLSLERFQFARMVSIFPLGFLEKRWSWKMDAGIEAPKDLACEGCHVFHAGMAWGASLDIWRGRTVGYGLAGAFFDFGSGLARSFRLGPTAEAGFLSNPWQPYKIRIEGKLYVDPFQPYRSLLFSKWGVDQSFSWNSHWETRLEAQLVLAMVGAPQPYSEAKFSVQYYF